MIPLFRKCGNLQVLYYIPKNGCSKDVCNKITINKAEKHIKVTEKNPKKIAEFIVTDYPSLPEEPTTCCMSGCANCVWLDYSDKLTEYFRDGGAIAIKEINERISDPNIRAYLNMEIKLRKKFK